MTHVAFQDAYVLLAGFYAELTQGAQGSGANCGYLTLRYLLDSDNFAQSVLTIRPAGPGRFRGAQQPYS